MSVDLSSGRLVPVAHDCGWDDHGHLHAVDRYASDYPPIPYTGPILECYGDTVADPDQRVIECEDCGGPLDLETLQPR